MQVILWNCNMFTDEQEIIVYHKDFSSSFRVPLNRVSEIISTLANQYKINEVRICGNSAFGYGYKEEILNTYAINYGTHQILNIEEV